MGRPHRQKPRRRFTDEELAQLEGYAAIRLPMEQIAALFNVSAAWFNQMIKDSDAAQMRIQQGRAKSSAKYRKTLFEMATVERNPRMIEFWGYTQEGFKKTDVIEHAGSIGSGLTGDQLKKLFSDPDSIDMARTLAERLSRPKPDDGGA